MRHASGDQPCRISPKRRFSIRFQREKRGSFAAILAKAQNLLFCAFFEQIRGRRLLFTYDFEDFAPWITYDFEELAIPIPCDFEDLR